MATLILFMACFVSFRDLGGLPVATGPGPIALSPTTLPPPAQRPLWGGCEVAQRKSRQSRGDLVVPVCAIAKELSPPMAENSVYRVTELIGVSSQSWEDAAKNAVETAAKSLEDLRIAEVVKLDLTIDKGKVTGYRARLNVSFKYHAGS
jgi:flavin-binding protein dodecin